MEKIIDLKSSDPKKSTLLKMFLRFSEYRLSFDASDHDMVQCMGGIYAGFSGQAGLAAYGKQ